MVPKRGQLWTLLVRYGLSAEKPVELGLEK